MVIRRAGWSAVWRKSMANVGLALIGVTGATGALAQTVTQTLTLTFPGSAPVPIGGWTAAAIAVLLAMAGGLFLRRRSRGATWLWAAALLSTGALLALQSIRSADAIVPSTPLNLFQSPALLQFTFPGAPPTTNVLVTNDTGATTTLLSITLSAGPYTFVGLPNPCTVGLVLAPGATCMIGLQVGA